MARRAQRENNEHNVPRLIEVNRLRDVTFYRLRFTKFAELPCYAQSYLMALPFGQ